jgi:hypothetical protein
VKATFRAFAPALLLALAACPTASPNKPAVILRTTIVPADSVRMGDSLKITTWLKNPEPEAMIMTFEDQCQVEQFVQTPDKTIVYPPGGGSTCISVPSTLRVAGRDSVRFDAAWLANSSVQGEYVAYGVLSQHQLQRGERDQELKMGHRSNIAIFHVAAQARGTAGNRE